MKSDLVVSAGLGLEIRLAEPCSFKNRSTSDFNEAAQEMSSSETSSKSLERPQGAVDRSQGDLHAEGNPHFNLSPKALSQASQQALEKALIVFAP
jgi:ABC-type Zn uptake system ZnuABC Zn-binding protein ZnuA